MVGAVGRAWKAYLSTEIVQNCQCLAIVKSRTFSWFYHCFKIPGQTVHSLMVCRGPGENSHLSLLQENDLTPAEALEVQVHMVISVVERFQGQVAM